jgi:hypothetical protein
MAGLDPAIYVLVTAAGDPGNLMDARVEPAHDDLRSAALKRMGHFGVTR